MGIAGVWAVDAIASLALNVLCACSLLPVSRVALHWYHCWQTGATIWVATLV
jgi:hypothetical protein